MGGVSVMIMTVPYAGIARIRFDGLSCDLSALLGTPTDDL